MSTRGNKPTFPRALSTFLKCDRCRMRKVKCLPEKRERGERCVQCTKSGHDCSDGVLSPRAHLSQLLREPSNPTITHHIKNRLEQIWGNYRVFTENGFSPTFSRTVSDFFGIDAPRMAQSNRMVLEALHACGAADALRNHKLPRDIRNEYELAYNGHDIRGRKLILKAYKAHLEKKAAGEHYDVLPLYYAVFLIHASGACVRGKEDIGAAMIAFKQLNTLTDEFPLKIELVPESGEDWTVRMLLRNSTDTGMIISHSHFPLGKTREEYDRIKISS